MRLHAIVSASLIFLCGALEAKEACKAVRIARDEIAEARPIIPIMRAVAALNPTKGSGSFGKITFKKVDGGILIEGVFHGLPPGKHGLHIHEYNDFSSPCGASIGGHFNPTCSKHAGPDHYDRHVGDLGNVVADEFGNARYRRIDHVISFEGRNNIIGKPIAISNNADDFETQPTGNSGGISCLGLIVDQ